ncbi:MAG: DUF547 domain-containing protein [Rhodospirillales bacterium]
MRRYSRIGLAALLVACLAGFGSAERLFAPGAELWEQWTAHSPDDLRTIDHASWDRLLKTYVTDKPEGANRVAYAMVTPEDRKALDAYVGALAAVNISGHARHEQLAYWINLYNALTVQVVLAHYPVASIRDIDISPGLFADGPWGAKLVSVEGVALSLNDIEHRILRPIWRDPRIHYGVNCASVGCPDLRPEAFIGARVEQQLTEAARAYVNDPRGVSIEGGNVTVSKIYDWFIEDFGGDEDGVIDHLLDFAKPALALDLRRIGRLYDTAYDWSLNDAGK